jgi:nicotinamide-nucleotide amidase
MAQLPHGAKPIFNPVGAAPGALMEYDNTVVLALPGVPNEMYAVFENAIPHVMPKIGNLQHISIKEIVTNMRDESKIAPLLKSVELEIGGIFLKSLASRFGKDVTIAVRIVAYGENEQKRLNKIEDTVKLLKEQPDMQILGEQK